MLTGFIHLPKVRNVKFLEHGVVNQPLKQSKGFKVERYGLPRTLNQKESAGLNIAKET